MRPLHNVASEGKARQGKNRRDSEVAVLKFYYNPAYPTAIE